MDDDELQAALVWSRRAKIPKTKKMSSQEIAAKVTAERAENIEAGDIMAKMEDESEDEGAIEATKEPELGSSNSQDIGTSQQTYSSGMASTLNIFCQQGILTPPTTDQAECEQMQLQRDLWLTKQCWR